MAGNYGLGLEIKKQKYPEASKGGNANSIMVADFFMLKCGKHGVPFTIGIGKNPNWPAFESGCANDASGRKLVRFERRRASPVDFKIVLEAGA